MLYFIFIWNSLLITTSAIGFYSLHLFKVKEQIQFHQYAILVFWLGLALQCLLLLLVGTMTAIGSMLGILLIIIIMLEVLLHTTQLKQYWGETSFTQFFIKALRVVGFPLIVCEIVFATLLLKPMSWIDTGLYHLGSIQWLSQYGLVPGLALINQKFGFISSWFSFSAALVPQFLGDRIGAVSSGFLLVLSAFTVLLILRNWQQQERPKLEDIFLSVFLLGLSLFYLLVWGAGEPILLSFSHDLAVNYSVGFFIWLIILLSRMSADPPVAMHQRDNINRTFDMHVLPIVIAFCILSFKLTGIFLIPIAYLFFMSQHIRDWKKWLVASLTSLVLILPLAIAQFKTSGCFLYPAQTFCLDFPWTVPTRLINSEAAPIIGEGFFGFLSGGLISALINTWYTLKAAAIGNVKVRVGVFLLFIFIGLVIWRVIDRRKTPLGELWVLSTAIGGSLFIFLLNKYVIFRFGGGVMLILPIYFTSVLIYRFVSNSREECLTPPAFSASICAHNSKSPWHHKFFYCLPQYGYSIFSLIMVFGLAIAILTNSLAIQKYILIPPTLPSINLLHEQVNNISYTIPKDWTLECWNADLPCAPKPLPDVQLRNSRKGLGGGFALVDQN